MSFLKLYKRPSENQIIKKENRISINWESGLFYFNLERQFYTGADGAAIYLAWSFAVLQYGWQGCVCLHFMPLVYKTNLFFQK